MSDRIAVALPDGRWLALAPDAFREAIAAGSELMGTPSAVAAFSEEPLLDASQAAAQMNVTPRWLEDSARAGIIPHHKLGRFIRFRVSEIAAHCHIEGASLARPTDSQSVTPIRRVWRQ